MEFDVDGARKAGYTDKDIAEYLAQVQRFDLQGARDATYSDSEIIPFLLSQQIVDDDGPKLEQGEAPQGFWSTVLDKMGIGTEDDVAKRKAQASVMLSNAQYDTKQDRAELDTSDGVPAPHRPSEYWGPDRGALPDAAVAAGRGVTSGAELMLRAARLGGVGIDTTDQIEAVQRFSEKAFPRSYEALNQPVRKALDSGIESTISSLTTRLPGLVAGAVTSGSAGAVMGQALSGGAIYGAAEYDSFIEEAKAKGIDPDSVRKEALLSAAAEGGLEGLSNYLDVALMGLTSPAKAGMKNQAMNFVKNYAKVSMSEVPTEMVQSASETALRNKVGITDASPWEEAKSVVAPTLISSALFAGMGTTVNALRGRGNSPSQTGDVATRPPSETSKGSPVSELGNTLPSELEEQPFDMADSPSFAKADESFTVNPNAFTQGDPEHLPGGPALPAGRSLSALSLPEGTGAIRMGMDSSGRGPIAPPTEFSSPIAQGMSRGIIGLPESTQDTEHSGQWSGGRSQLAYDWGNSSPLQVGLEGLKKSITGMSLAEAAQPAKIFQPSAGPESGFPVSLQQPVTASSIQQPASSAPVQQGLEQRPAQDSPVPMQQPQPNPMPLPEPVGPQGMNLASAGMEPAVSQPQAQPISVAAEQARPVMQPEQVVQPQPRKENEHGQEVQAQNEALLDARKAALPDREQVRARLSSMARKDLVEMLGGEPKAKRPVKKAELVEAILNRQFSVESAEAPLDESPVQGMVKAQRPETDPAQEAPHAGRGKVRDTGRNGGEGSNSEDGFLQGDRGGHGAAVRIMDDGGRGGDGGRPAQHAQEERAGRRAVAIKVPNRNDEPAHYELLESDEVRASHLPSAGFQKNPAYKLENERRYHDEPGSQAKVMENAAKLDPAFLMDSVDANHGAPVIDHDNNVLGGNGRAMSIARAYESFPERGKQYREALKANADKLGIDPAQVDAMRSPVLVRRLERGMKREERQQLVSAMNDDFKDAKEKRASGKSRGERFGRRTLDMLSAGLKDAESLREYFDTPASVAVVERMMEDGVIQRSERNALVGADGLLNPDGKKVVEEALRGRIARSYEALAKLPADVVGKLDAVIPHILVAEGIGKPWDISEHVRDSVDLLVGFKGSGVKEPDIYLKQVNMLTGRAPVQDFSKQAIALFHMALDAKKGEYVKAFEKYVSQAKLSPEAGGMPGVAKPQDKAFSDSFGMEEEAAQHKPEKTKERKPEAKEKTEGRPPEDAFGMAFPAFSGKPKEAIEHLMKTKEGHVPAAFHKKGLGDIDLPWGKAGKKGFGLAHIIERRNQSGMDGEAFARSLPVLIRDGRVETRPNYPGRAYIVSEKAETAIRLEWDGKRRNWIVTAYPLNKGTPGAVDGLRTSVHAFGDKQSFPLPHSGGVENNISTPKQTVNSENSSFAQRHQSLYKAILIGKASLEEYRQGFSDLLKQEEAVRAELSGMTVNDLLERGGTVFALQHKGEKKADIIDALYRDMLSDFTLGQPYSVSGMMGMGAEEYKKATVASIRKIVDAQTEQTLADFAKSRAEQREEYASRRKAAREAIENPKTLDDFRAFMRFHMDDGKTATESRDLLSFEQREQFDRLAAEANRSSRKTKMEPVLPSASQTTDGEIIATKHTQKGHDLFVVRLGERVSREDYLALLSSAKRLGGYYSKFRGNGAVPGFQFTEREQAEAFLKLAQGDKAEAQEAIKARRDAYEDDRSQTAVQRLNEMADRLDEDADASLNAERKMNTAKRARQAASADATAYTDKALAKTMRNIAEAIKDGTATFLDKVREKKQVEQLRDDLRRAKWEEDKTKYPGWSEREKHSEEPATTQTVEFAAFPHYKLYRSSWAELGRKLIETDGTKTLGKKILSVADDVTETYLSFAREHLEEVSTYATQGGKPAVFKSREDAEKAIVRSGYRGKAVVLPVKRGENRIILSPSAAQELGVWKGDDDRMITLRPEFVDELFDKLGSSSHDIPWQLSGIRQRRRMLARMGIETPAEYRMALREFVGLQAAAKQDKVRELERTVMRDAANNRGWLDFFPTPAAVTEELLAAADIKPGMTVLEPSAGMGHIADRIREQGVDPVVVELDPQKRELLEAKGYEVVGNDFMKDVPDGESFDRIVMNPPFSKRQDTEHVRRAYDLLNPGGRLVAIVSEGSFFGKDKKASEFRDWLEEVGGTSEKLEEGSFNDPALPVTTGVNTRMVLIEKVKSLMASVTPGEFLPEVKASRLHVRKAAVQSVADALGKRSANAAETQVVQSFEELPEHIRQLYGEVSSRLEGVYDPASGTVYLVADNLVSSARAAEVWMHENMVHHGINGLLGEREKVRLLNQMWKSMGGMGNPQIAAISKKYGLDPRSDTEGRALIMEEVLASLAEKRAADKLTGQDKTYWRRFVDAVLRAWNALADAVSGRTGSMKYENMDRLLSALDAFVFEGKPEGVEQGGMVPAMASKRSDPNNAHFSPDMGKKTDFVTLPDGSVDFAQFPATRLKDMCVLRAAPIRLERGVHSMEGGQGLRHIEANHGDEIRAAGYGSVQEFVWDLVNGYNQIWEGEGKSLLLLKNNGTDSRPAGFIELERNGSFYKVKNAYPVDRSYPTAATRKQLWKSAPPSSIATGEQSPSIPVSGHRNPFQDQTGNLQGQRGQSSEKNIQQGGMEGKLLASLSELADTSSPEKTKAFVDAFERHPALGELSTKQDLSLVRRICDLPHWIAKNYPEFSGIYERQLRRREERAAQLQKTLEQVPSLFGDKNIATRDMDDLKRLIWDNNGKQIEELAKVEKFRAVRGEDGKPELLGNTDREKLEMNPDYVEKYKHWLNGQEGSKAAKKSLLEIRRVLDESFLRSYNTLGTQKVDDSILKEMRTRVGHIHNYFPMHRYGDYYLHGYTTDTNGKHETVYREHFDAMTEKLAQKQANRRMRELEKQYPGTQWAWGENEKLPEEWFGTPVKSEALQQIIDASIKRIDDKELAGKIEGVLSAAVADTIKMRGWGSHLIGRKAIPGFEREDISRVLYDYLSGQTGWLTKMEATKDFTTLLGKIKSTKKSGLWSYSVNYVEDMLRNSDKVDRIVGNMKAAAFLYFLGGNLKTAAVNLTQNIVVGVPMLHMDVKGPVVGYWKAALNTLGKQVFTSAKFKAGIGLSEDEANMLNDLYMEDVTTEGYLRDIRGRVGSRGSKMFGKVMRAAGYFMEVAERFNRASLALAAYRAARDGKLTPVTRKNHGIDGKASYAQAKDYASALVKDAHYVYGKDNLPEPMRHSQAGRVLSPMYTFRAFSHNYISGLLYAIKSRGAAGWAYAARSLAGLIALGGLTSFPFYSSIMALVQCLTGDDDDWTQQIRKALPESDWLRDVTCYGFPSLGGVYIGSSLRIETPLERGIKPGATPKDILTDSLGSIIGIPYSAVEISSRMVEAGRGGSLYRVLEEAAPVALKNAMSAYRLVTEGQTTMKGRPITEGDQPRKLTSGEAVGKALGFQPVSSTKNYDRYRAGQHAELVRREKADEIATKMFRARQDNDGVARKEAREAFVEWNDKMRKEGKPDMLIRTQDIERRVRDRMRPQRPSQRERAREQRME